MEAEGDSPAGERATIRKVMLRILPLSFLLYVIAYIDRANIGYAALKMNAELGLSGGAFGFAAGIFFLGYVLFEVPSNLMLARFGARRWIARIVLTWGVVSAATAFVQDATQLYVLRFLLGVAEAGFFPGIIVYLTLWFRPREQAMTIALFTAAIPASYVIGAPLSTFILDHGGWRWMFLCEGLPAVLGGVAAYFLLTDRPEQARWLDADERAWLKRELAAETRDHGSSTLSVMIDPRVLYLSAIYFIYQCGSLGVGYWLPQILKSLAADLSDFEIGIAGALPYAVATLGMILWSRHSDRTGERRRHAAMALLAAALALAMVAFVSNPIVSLALIAAALTGLYAFKAPFWALPSLFLSRDRAAVSIAVINSIGNLGGFVGPWLVGVVKDHAGTALAGLWVLAAMTFCAFLMTRGARIAAA